MKGDKSMETKLIYLYDTQGYYAGPHTLTEKQDKTPVTRDWIIPANSTELPMELEPKEHYLIHWSGSEWEYVEDKGNPPPQPEPVKTLEEVKTDKLLELKGTRDMKEVEPITISKGIFDYDDKARDRLQIARQALEDANEGGTITWTTADNQRVPISIEDFAEINAAAATRSNALHIKYNELKTQVNACETIEEVKAITWEE